MSGTPLRNLRFFESLCGKKFGNIVLTTTMWDLVEEEQGSCREKELKDIFWKSMIARGSTVRRFRCTRASALEVLEPIFDEIDRKGILLLQKEMIDLGLHLNQTTAGRTLFSELEKTVSHQQSALEKIRRNSSNIAFNEDERRQLEQEKERVSKELERALEDRQQLRISLLQKVLLTSRFPRSWGEVQSSQSKLPIIIFLKYHRSPHCFGNRRERKRPAPRVVQQREKNQYCQ